MTQNCEFLFGYTNLVVNGVIVLLIILNFVVHKFRQVQEAELQLQEAELTEQNNGLLLLSTQDGCYRFSLDQMQRATSNFHDELVIGKGGFGNVYKGTFEVGPTIVAIKRLHSRSRQGPLEFRTEIDMLSKFRHSHLVSLIGYCDHGNEMILVYEFMPGGTLADHLYKKVRQGDQCTPTLSWVQRLKVCIGAARGLDYLHTGTGIQHRIIHRDVKTTNILLDENLEAKISDFGLSKLSPANQAITYVSTHVKGTFGYLDPYYFSTHRLTRKSDVYSFGVVLFEVLCGRPAVDRTLDTEQMGLADWAQHCFRKGLLGNIIDPKIKDEASPDCLEAFVKVAVQCLQFGPNRRPTMAEVVVALEYALVLQEKIDDYILPEITISDDDHQDDIDFSELEVETADSEKRTVDVSKGSHQEKQSSTRMNFTERIIVYRKNFLQALGGRAWRRHSSIYDAIEDFLHSQNNLMAIRYTYSNIKKITNNFREKLGQGGYGTVYKGKLRSGLLVAVKTLDRSNYTAKTFINEVSTIGRIHHVNVIKLVGFCSTEGQKHALIYEFMPNGSLEKYIFREGREEEIVSLSWEKMYEISYKVATGIDYLHRGCDMKILHLNIQPRNILLDKDFNPTITDFGLAKLYATDDSFVSLSAARGTACIAPEMFYKKIGEISHKADVYNFGMLLMEMAGRRRNLNPLVDNTSQIYFPSWVFNQFNDGKELEMEDVTEEERKLVKKMIIVALWCIQWKPSERPSMKKIIEMLEGDIEHLVMPPNPIMHPQEDPVESNNSAHSSVGILQAEE